MSTRINPYYAFGGTTVPGWLMINRDLSPGAKLCYSLLLESLGDSDRDWASSDGIGEGCGLAGKEVLGCMLELENYGLIAIEDVSKIFFVQHTCMSAGVTMVGEDA